jgi:hypothetical protein
MIHDAKAGKSLALYPQSKTAVLMPGPSDAPSSDELFDKLVNIEQDAAKKLGEQTFDGRKLVGFELKPAKHQRADITARVWVDPQTRLPVRCEAGFLSPGDPRTASPHQITTFTFNRPLDESLFAMTPPEGYTLSETAPLERPSPPPPEDSSLASPVIKPGVGIGEARFGMNVEEVMKALGKPERIQRYWDPTPEEERIEKEVLKKAKEENLDRFERQRLLDEAHKKFDTTKRKPDGMSLSYSDRGFWLSVANDRGFQGIQCYAHHPGMQPFTGKTAEGIAMGATAEEIENTYGPPDAKSDFSAGVFFIHYRDLGLSFHTDEGRLWLIMAGAPDK